MAFFFKGIFEFEIKACVSIAIFGFLLLNYVYEIVYSLKRKIIEQFSVEIRVVFHVLQP